MKKLNITFTTILLLLGCFWLLPEARPTDLDGVLPGGNNADGFRVLTNLTSGGYNTGSGWFSLFSDQAGSFNTAFGAATLFSNTGDQNTATGAAALFFNTGSFNTANGALALLNNTTGVYNAANGAGALYSNTTGFSNTANGGSALFSNTTGTNNTASGLNALFMNTTGSANTALGAYAGSNLTTGSGNIDIASAGVAAENNTIRIGTTQTSTYIAGISGQTASGGVAVYVNADGKLGTATSSARFKDEIKPMNKASEAILALKPVSFRYKHEVDPEGTPQFGLVAEEVEKVNPALVARDAQGKVYTVRYEAVNAMLLNEFLKQHRNVQELQATVAQQQKDIKVLNASLREQASQIQKVSAQLEVSKPAPQMVINNP